MGPKGSTKLRKQPATLRFAKSCREREPFGSEANDLTLLFEEHFVEDEELADPHYAKGGETGEVDHQRMRVPSPRNEPDGDCREYETQERKTPEGYDLTHEVVLPAFLPDPVAAEEIGGDGADADREDVRRHRCPPKNRLSSE